MFEANTAAAVDLTSLLLPVNSSQWTGGLNESLAINTTFPDSSLFDDDIVWPETVVPSSSNLPSSHALALNTSSVGAPKLSCNGRAYGKNLDLPSCVEAFAKMTFSEIPVLFGERGHGQWEANLPFRILSSNGLCAIDISHRANIWSDKITASELKLNAGILIDVCVKGTPNQGGVISNIGDDGNLAVRVTPYRPTVYCDPPGSNPPWADCRTIIDNMPVDGTKQVFGQKNDSDSEIEVSLPAGYSTGQRRCQVYVDTLETDIKKDTFDWYKLWAAANAVDYMCVQYKRSGLAIALGWSQFPLNLACDEGQ